MSLEERQSEPKLRLRISTLSGIVFEGYVFSLKVMKKDGLMVVNQNYSSVMEQLADGPVVIREKTKKTSFDLTRAWLTVRGNICEIYASRAVEIPK